MTAISKPTHQVDATAPQRQSKIEHLMSIDLTAATPEARWMNVTITSAIVAIVFALVAASMITIALMSGQPSSATWQTTIVIMFAIAAIAVITTIASGIHNAAHVRSASDD